MVYVKFDEMFIGRTHREKAVFPDADNQTLAVANLQIIDPAGLWRRSWWGVFD